MSPSLPKTYKAALVEEKGGEFKIVERPLQEPKAGEILVKVLACGVCHSDGMVKIAMVPLPRVPGHEVVGDVVAVGPGEARWKIGDRVGGGWHGGHCHHCSSCTSGDFITCENQNINGILSDGGYAEYVTLRTEAVASIPKDLDPAEAAPLLCAGVTTFNSLRHMDLHPGDLVAVQGIGGLGHLGIQFARQMGYRVAALSSSGAKKSLATSLGAHEYIDGSQGSQAEALNKLGGAKVILCTAPSSDVIHGLLGGIKADGTLLVVALAENLTIPNTSMLIQKRISIRGWPSGTARDCEDTIAFAQLEGVKCMVEKFPLAKVNEAYQHMITNKANFRAVLIP